MKLNSRVLIMSAMVLLCVLLLPHMEAEAAEIVDSGACGANLTWTLDDEGTLTISGEGEMEDYGYAASPWTGNSSITAVMIGSGVTKIGRQAFRDCSGLTGVLTIPDGVTNIGAFAFCNCRNLTGVEIGDGLVSIGEWAFVDCSSLTGFDVSTGNSEFCSDSGVLFNKNKTELIQYPAGKPETEYVIPDSVTRIGSQAFWYCTGLKGTMEIPDSVTSIGDNAFWACGMKGVLRIPESVKSIGENAFYYCSSLTEIDVSPENTNDCRAAGVPTH